mmetsp:Transcript_55308/g.61836  ORF Transcript_55308/g.61836 Transcript_55308/m.61836 type:complete len:492 (+) Transcript_55308:93-1568(+)
MIRPQKMPTVGVSSKIREEVDSTLMSIDKERSKEADPTSITADSNEENDSNNDVGNINSNDNEEETVSGLQQPEKEIKLYKSPRLTGYLTMFLASIINFHGVLGTIDLTSTNETQRIYGFIVALVSSVASGFCVLCHLDRCSCLANTWRNNLFAPKSKFEAMLDVLLLLWWFMAVIIQTRVHGIAGDGKKQFNIYFSTWCCFFCAISILESKMMEHDLPSIKKFIKSWPHRAPGWISIFIIDFFTLFWYVDVYTEYFVPVNEELDPQLVFYYKNIPSYQYEILIFVAAATLLPSAAFVFMEIFRVSSDDKKGTLETLLEAISLLVLACVWVPVVCTVTAPGGFASKIGNSWFFTWMTCFLVMETLLWFVSDSRGGIHQTLLQREQEYHQHQLNVLATTKDMQSEAVGQQEDDSHVEEDYEMVDENDDNNSLTRRVEDPPADPEMPIERVAIFEMKDDSENDENLDDSIRQEIRMKETDRKNYFDTLDDILE